MFKLKRGVKLLFKLWVKIKIVSLLQQLLTTQQVCGEDKKILFGGQNTSSSALNIKGD